MGAGLTTGAHARLAGTLVADGLFGLAWDGRPVDRVIIPSDWTNERRTLKLKLRPNLLWHNGTPVEAAQVKQTISSAIKEPLAPASLKSITDIVLDPKEPDALTIHLSRPEAFLLVDLSTSTLRHPNDEKIGTGPYKYGQQTHDTIQLLAFEHYYRGTPKLQQINIKNFGQPRAAWSALLAEEVDAVHEIASTGAEISLPDTVRSYPFIRPYYIQLAFNTQHPELRNPVVRQALSYSVDRQKIIDEGMNKQGMVAEGPIWPYHWAYSTAQKTYTHNIEAATLRLESAGLKIKPGKAGRMPSRLHLRCFAPEKNALYEKVAMLLQKQLYEIGVDLEIIPLPGDEVGKRLDSGQFETVLIPRTTGRSLSWTYSTYHSSASPSRYSSADKVLDRLRQTDNENEIRAAVSDLQQIFHDDPPALFIAWPKTARVVRSTFIVPDQEETVSPRRGEAGRDIFSSIWQWSLVEPRR